LKVFDRAPAIRPSAELLVQLTQFAEKHGPFAGAR
jgi:hypothetical protein